jgi:hypothetical protein
MKVKQLLTLVLSLLPLFMFSACSDNGSSNTSDESNGDPASEESIDNSTSTDESFVSDTDDFDEQTNAVMEQTEFCNSLPNGQEQIECLTNAAAQSTQ